MPQKRPSLDDLLSARSDLWRGQRRPAGQTVSSGRAELDAWLPTGGWSCGRLTELLPVRWGIGEMDMLLPLLARQTGNAQPVLLAGPPWLPCPQALIRAGVILDRLIVIRARAHALWATEQSLKSGLFGAVILWHPGGQVQAQTIRRLHLSAANGRAPVFVCYRPGQQPPPSLSALRLAIQPGPELSVLRGCPEKSSLQLGRSNVIALAEACRPCLATAR